MRVEHQANTIHFLDFFIHPVTGKARFWNNCLQTGITPVNINLNCLKISHLPYWHSLGKQDRRREKDREEKQPQFLQLIIGFSVLSFRRVVKMDWITILTAFLLVVT